VIGAAGAGATGWELIGAGFFDSASVTPPDLVFGDDRNASPRLLRKKSRGKNGSGARKKVRRAARAEEDPRRPAAEGSPHVGPLPVLQKDQHDDRDARDDVKD